jgi:hypothetical protein
MIQLMHVSIVIKRTIISSFIKRGNHYKYNKGAVQHLFLRKESKSAYAQQSGKKKNSNI